MVPSRSTLISCILSVLAHGSYVRAQHDEVVPLTPLPYTPNKIVATVAGTLFLLVAAGFSVWSLRYRARYVYFVMLGCVCYGLGLLLRIVYANDPTNMTKFAAMDMLILLSPCCFVVAVFMILEPLAVYLNAAEFLIINPNTLTYGFLGSEIVAFTIQAIGGGLKTSTSRNTVKTGTKIIIAGLLVQLFALLTFLGLYVFFIIKMWTRRKDQWNNRPLGFFRHWLFIAAMVGVCCQNLVIPSIYRLTAIAVGSGSALNNKELYFYTTEVMTIFGAIANLLWAYPPRVLNGNLPVGKDDTESSLATNPSS